MICSLSLWCVQRDLMDLNCCLWFRQSVRGNLWWLGWEEGLRQHTQQLEVFKNRVNTWQEWHQKPTIPLLFELPLHFFFFYLSAISIFHNFKNLLALPPHPIRKHTFTHFPAQLPSAALCLFPAADLASATAGHSARCRSRRGSAGFLPLCLPCWAALEGCRVGSGMGARGRCRSGNGNRSGVGASGRVQERQRGLVRGSRVGNQCPTRSCWEKLPEAGMWWARCWQACSISKRFAEFCQFAFQALGSRSVISW